jgi:non-reducing end alpha-L-arabinofuranosidase
MRVCCCALATLLVAGAAASGPSSAPCDILGAAGNPCVAAHSTVRSLYAQYSGPLYRVRRPDNSSAIISALGPGGFADIAAQETFCAAGDCVIANVFDQSPQGNHLGQRISDGVVHKMVNASRHKVGVAGGAHQVYGMWFDPGHGYHIDDTTGVAKGNEPESIYAVMSGTHYNGQCCFDYGNSENTRLQPVATGDYACGAMEAIYLGNAHWQGNTGAGAGPWVGADLEAGMFYGGGNQTKANPANKPLTTDFVSLHLKGRTDGFALKGGDATQGAFETMYDGPRPDHRSAPNDCHWHGVNGSYQPMRKQGAIILGTGGDNSNGAVGTFFEGFIASGVTSDETDDQIQASIVAVGYKTLPAPALA